MDNYVNLLHPSNFFISKQQEWLMKHFFAAPPETEENEEVEDVDTTEEDEEDDDTDSEETVEGDDND